jgi:hypothetical protein
MWSEETAITKASREAVEPTRWPTSTWKDNQITVTENGCDFVAIYEKAKHDPELIAKGKLYGPREFLSRACWRRTKRHSNSDGIVT